MKMKCDCEHKAQDELNGPGIRVFNKMKDPNPYKCTVCLAVKGPSKVPEKKK